MVEVKLSSGAGGFLLDVACTLAAPLTVIFGPSGAGKSTLLRMMAGTTVPQRGVVRLDGRTLTDTSQKMYCKPGRRGVMLAGQQAALFPHMTVEKNVGFGLRSMGSEDRTERIVEALEVVGAAALAHRRVATLSGGEAQRVALARALAPRPRLLLLDEPLSALDTTARDAVMTALLQWLGEHRIQTIVVTHDAADALRAQAEVVWLREGRVVAQGAAIDVLAEERKRLLARLSASAEIEVKNRVRPAPSPGECRSGQRRRR